MGTIVSLPTRPRRRRVSVSTTSEATILLFMGVRYVRDLEPEAPVEHTKSGTRSQREEAALELA